MQLKIMKTQAQPMSRVLVKNSAVHPRNKNPWQSLKITFLKKYLTIWGNGHQVKKKPQVIKHHV